MTIIKLKAKNQITIPAAVAKRLGLKLNEFLAIDVVDNFIKLMPVTVDPKYTQEDLEIIDHIVAEERINAKGIKPGKGFSDYLKKL